MQANMSTLLLKKILQHATKKVTWTVPGNVAWESTSVKQFKEVLSNVPQSVIVVTGAKRCDNNESWKKRGATCSSFTGISLEPAYISFAMRKPSRIFDILEETGRFAVHVLSEAQVVHGLHFAKPSPDDKDQFEDIPHEQDNDGLPIIKDVSTVLRCKLHSANCLGDHYVCYGEVLDAYTNGDVKPPLLYFQKAFRTIGDEVFMKAFEDTTFPFEDWTHEAHLRMAYNYLSKSSLEEATPLIREGLFKYNERNKEKLTRGYNETITLFFIHIINYTMHLPENVGLTFDEFISKNNHIIEKDFIKQYYTWETVTSKKASQEWIPPDLKPLP